MKAGGCSTIPTSSEPDWRAHPPLFTNNCVLRTVCRIRPYKMDICRYDASCRTGFALGGGNGHDLSLIFYPTLWICIWMTDDRNKFSKIKKRACIRPWLPDTGSFNKRTNGQSEVWPLFHVFEERPFYENGKRRNIPFGNSSS